MRNILVFGASGHAKVVISIIEAAQARRVAGLIVSDGSAAGSVYGCPVLGSEDDLPRLLAEHHTNELVIAVGDNHGRHLVRERLAAIVPDCRFPPVVHPSVQAARGVIIGQGTVVVAGATLNADARIGEFCIVDAQANIGHDAAIEDFASAAPQSSIGGDSVLGSFTAVGMGAVVIEKVRIGEHTVVGAGATVVGDLPERVVALGTPARPVRNRTIGEKYYR